MAKYNSDCKNEYAMQLMGECFRNSLKYYKKSVFDYDYFYPVFSMADTKEIEQTVYDVFGGDSLVESGVAHFTEKIGREPHNGRKYGNPEVFYANDNPLETIRDLWNDKEHQEKCRQMLIGIADRFVAEHSTPIQGDLLKERFDSLKSFFGFSDLEMDALKYAFIRKYTVFRDYPFNGRYHRSDKAEKLDFFAMCIDHSVPEVRELMKEQSRLRIFDFLDEDLDLRGSVENYLNGEDDQPLHGRFYRKAKSEDVLPWDFYPVSLREHGSLLKRLISTRRKGQGVNILLYGAPGTGKTSFAMTIARELGLEAYEIMHGEKDGEDTSLASRLIGVQVCNEQIVEGKGIMVVDEADQILNTGGGNFFGMAIGGKNASEKGQVNSMLDSMRCPVIWISNSPADSMDDSVRRRFDYSICFKKLTHSMRMNIWKNNIKKFSLENIVPESEISSLAGKYDTNAGGISMVLKNLKNMSPQADEVPGLLKRLMEPHCELMEAKTADDVMLPAKDYSLEGLNLKGDIELGRITEAVGNYFREIGGGEDVGVDRPRMNLLLWGPPGTGKTEFVKYLAKAVNRKVIVKMGSDLLSMWVGGTEKNIKAAFDEAESENAILFLDEIDGLVQDRSGAQRSWEVTQVNELLHRMENFKGVMVGATNFRDNLDQAIMRRFTFKLQFDYLDEVGKRLFFERMFNARLSDEESARLAEIGNLAPGDFRTVRQSMYYLGGSISNAQRIEALRQESALKRDVRKARPIGFGV